ncbi:centrosomal protein POC5-like isoform X2 [Babylonia areolata]|uniref:centrosomal protein POC5-like isoform X2 n=1 Tax=Babylonia areolata TaxID=304850 RepID=UPI003FD4CB85
MSERLEERMSEGSGSDVSVENPPVIPPDSPGSSVSTRLQEEYDELLKYAVVVPDYNPKDIRSRLTDTKGFFGRQDDILTLRASPRHGGIFQDLDRMAQREQEEEEEREERTPRRREDHSGGGVKQLPDFGESPIDSHGPTSFTQHLRAETSEEERGFQPHTQPMFPNTAGNPEAAGRSHLRDTPPVISNPIETVYTATIDQDVGKMETLLDQWCLDLKRNVLAEFSQAKIVIEQKTRQELLRETNRHCKEKADLIKELNSLKEFLHTYDQSMERKDSIISNLTQAMYRQRDKLQLMQNFCQWRVHHNDLKREAFTVKMAKCHHERTLKRRVLSAWFSLIHSKWRQRVEKACQNKAQEICMQVTADYEAKIASLNEAQESSREEIRHLHTQRERYEEAMKKAFMRGVCALNMEAMSMFHGEDSADTQAAQYSGREDRDREDDLSDNLDSQVPDKGPPSSKTIPHDAVHHPSVFTDAQQPRVVTSQGSRPISAATASSRQTSAKPSSSTGTAHKTRVVVAKVPGKGGDSGRSGTRSLSPSLHPPMASVVVERHQPVTKQTIGHATAVRFNRSTTEADKFRKLAGQQGTVGKPPPIHTVRVVE